MSLLRWYGFAEFEEATRLQPSLAIAYVWMGWLHLLMGSPEQAVEPAEQAVELDPLAPQARVFLAEIYLARGETEAALREAIRARGLSSAVDTEADSFSAGLVHAALGEQREALQAFERVRDWGQLSIEHLRYFFPEVLGPLRDSIQFKEFLQRADQIWGVRQERD